MDIMPHVFRSNGVLRRYTKSLRKNFVFYNLSDQQVSDKILLENKNWLSFLDTRLNYWETRRYVYNFLPVLYNRGYVGVSKMYETVEHRGGDFGFPEEYPYFVMIWERFVSKMHTSVIFPPSKNKIDNLKFLFKTILKMDDLFEIWKIGYGEKWPECWRKFKADFQKIYKCENTSNLLISMQASRIMHPNIDWDIKLNGKFTQN